MKKSTLVLMLLMLLLVSASCRSYDQENASLQALLPDREGYRWVYWGFAEYGHSMTLTKAPIEEKGRTVYEITGMVDDPSGGEAPGPLDFSLVYAIEKGKLVRTLSAGSKVLDNRYPSLELLRAPLEQGATWKQAVTDRDGKQSNLTTTIVEIAEEDSAILYRVRYVDDANNYWEERVIKSGVGVISVELPYDDATIGYQLYDDASGYPNQLNLNAFLPPMGEEVRYYGLAEYAHRGQAQWVNRDDRSAIVEFTGEFEDGSGIPGTFKVQYLLNYEAGTVTEKVISNSRSGKPEVNSLIHDPIVLQLPLQAGTEWTQTVTVEGSLQTMHARIIQTTLSHGRPAVTVRYEVPGVAGYFRDTYLEERTFLAGTGMTGFSSLLPGDIGLSGKELDDDQLVEQALQQHMFGYVLYLPTP